MGQVTDARIAAWQHDAGITPATGARLHRLNRMADLAFELIQTLALEKSGIRDGDGQWHGCDPLAAVVRELRTLEAVSDDSRNPNETAMTEIRNDSTFQ